MDDASHELIYARAKAHDSQQVQLNNLLQDTTALTQAIQISDPKKFRDLLVLQAEEIVTKTNVGELDFDEIHFLRTQSCCSESQEYKDVLTGEFKNKLAERISRTNNEQLDEFKRYFEKLHEDAYECAWLAQKRHQEIDGTLNKIFLGAAGWFIPALVGTYYNNIGVAAGSALMELLQFSYGLHASLKPNVPNSRAIANKSNCWLTMMADCKDICHEEARARNLISKDHTIIEISE